MITKEKIISHLKAKGTYDEDVDDEQVEMLLQNLELYKLALQEVKKSGILITLVSGNKKINPALLAFQMFFRNINLIAGRLGISRLDRVKLKLIQEKTASEFEELLKT
jgi:phage terminase small subunit